MERLHLSWEDLLRLVRRLAEALSGEPFDLVLGVARGGLIPTALLAQALGARNILTAAIMFYEEAHEEEEASRLEPVPAGLFHLLQGHGLRPAEEGGEGRFPPHHPEGLPGFLP